MKRILFVLFMLYATTYSFSQTPQRIPVTAISSSINTGMNFTPWLNDSLTSLVQSAWGSINNQYVDVKVSLPYRVKLSKLSFYDYEGVFTTNPAYIYALKDTQKIYLGLFQGLQYKVFVDLAAPDTSTYADAIIVHKYGNNIPQKVQVYGIPVPGGPDSAPVAVTDTVTQIPIDPKRWYTLNNLSNGLGALFDSVTDVSVSTGYSSFISNYDSYYPVEKGEQITLKQIKLYDMYGTFANDPATISVIKTNGQRIQIATFTGSTYQTWVGPYPDRTTTASNRFNLDSAITDIKYIVLNCTNSDLPTELQFYGTYIAPAIDTLKAIKQIQLKNAFGINGFEWNFVNTSAGMSGVIDETKYAAIKNFTAFRQYQDWKQIEQTEGSYTFNPTRSGGWNYDIIYDRCHRDSIDMLVCMQTIPDWMVSTYPSGQQANDNSPLKYNKSYSDPQSYIEKAKAGFQMAARYGSNTNIDSSLIHINGTPRWTGDRVNTIKIGLGTLKYLECTNESDKWWKDRKGYLTSYEFAACLSAFYDGNKNTMGSGVGVKNADSTMKVVMGGIASRNPSYVRGMIEWCRQNRGYKADGKVNLCWDVINYHHYFNDATSQSNNPTRGKAPEKCDASATASAFVKLSHAYAGDMPVWVTESGYDINQGSTQKAIAIGSKPAAQTQADWTLRTALTYIRQGIEKVFFYELYDANINSSVTYSSMGLIDSMYKRKAAADYLYQANNLLGQYVYTQTLNTDPIVDQYNLNGNPAFVLTIPDEVGRTSNYSLNIGSYDSVIIYTPQAGSNVMSSVKVAVSNGVVVVPVSETPVFVLPVTATIYYTKTKKTSFKYSNLNSLPVAFFKKNDDK